jgi:hypothetical protein
MSECFLCGHAITPEETDFTVGENNLSWHWRCMQDEESLFD